MGFGQRRRYRPPAETAGRPEIRAIDTGHAWDVGAEDSRIRARRIASAPEPSSPATEPGSLVSGPAAGLYLFLWNRSDATRANVTVSGDPAFLNAWQSTVRVSWD